MPDAQLWMLETGPLPPSLTHTSALVSPGAPSCGCKWGILTQGSPPPVAPSLPAAPSAEDSCHVPHVCRSSLVSVLLPGSLGLCCPQLLPASYPTSAARSSLGPPTPSLRVCSDTLALSPPGGQLHSPSSRGQGVPPSPSLGLGRGPRVGDLGPECCGLEYTERPLLSSQTGLGQGRGAGPVLSQSPHWTP